jgi:UDP-N-acetyl-D-glucosamine dehydrogenase
VGGHCIAIDPSYLSWRVGQQTGHRLNFVEHAQEVNAKMPSFVAQRVAQALNEQGKPVRGSKVLGIGVTYKPDVNDVRESPALAVLERLAAEGARIVYHDPYVPSLEIDGKTLRSKKLTPSLLSGVDVAVVLAAHSAVDFGEVVRHAPWCSTPAVTAANDRTSFGSTESLAQWPSATGSLVRDHVGDDLVGSPSAPSP